MKLKHGKKYETADGDVYMVSIYDNLFNNFGSMWHEDGTATPSSVCQDTLIRRHYTKPKTAHKLDLKPGDVVRLVAWEDGANTGIGVELDVGLNGPESGWWELNQPKGERPLFMVVSRA